MTRIRAVIVGLLAVIVAFTAQLFVWPVSAEPKPQTADAVVLFSGGRGERLAAARKLIEDRVAPVLVISNGTDPVWPEANKLCEQPNVHCPRPVPDNTRGEARTIGALVGKEGWDSVVLVTSTYHATRAGTLLRRCVGTNVDVDVVAAKPHQSVLRTWAYAAKEWLALTRAQVDRDC